ncbi:MAG: hypothetical protein ABL866_04595 [Devosia sp.]
MDSHNRGEDEFEAGVAAIFAAIQADGFEEPPEAANDEADPTLVLLAELNRIWASPVAS